MRTGESHRIPPILLAAAFIPRGLLCGWVWAHPEKLHQTDSTGYLLLAKNLWQSRVFAYGTPPDLATEAFRLPGYPLFLAPFTFLFQNPASWIALAQSILGGVTVMLAWTWLRTFADDRAALIGSLVLALDLVTLLHTPLVLAETLVSFVQLMALIQTARTFQTPDRRNALFCGFLWGVSIMIKPVFLFIPLILFIIWAIQKRWMIVFLIAAYLMPASWIVRNGVQLGFWKLTCQSGFALLVYPATDIQAMLTGRSREDVNQELQNQIKAEHPLGFRIQAEESEAFGALAMRIIKPHPFLLLKDSAIGAVRILGGTGVGLWTFYLPDTFQTNTAYSLQAVSQQSTGILRKHLWLLPLIGAYAIGLLSLYIGSVIGTRQLWKARRYPLLALLLGGALYLLAAASHQGASRFRIPMMPFLVGLIAVAISRTPIASRDK